MHKNMRCVLSVQKSAEALIFGQCNWFLELEISLSDC